MVKLFKCCNFRSKAEKPFIQGFDLPSQPAYSIYLHLILVPTFKNNFSLRKNGGVLPALL